MIRIVGDKTFTSVWASALSHLSAFSAASFAPFLDQRIVIFGIIFGIVMNIICYNGIAIIITINSVVSR